MDIDAALPCYLPHSYGHVLHPPVIIANSISPDEDASDDDTFISGTATSETDHGSGEPTAKLDLIQSAAAATPTCTETDRKLSLDRLPRSSPLSDDPREGVRWYSRRTSPSASDRTCNEDLILCSKLCEVPAAWLQGSAPKLCRLRTKYRRRCNLSNAPSQETVKGDNTPDSSQGHFTFSDALDVIQKAHLDQYLGCAYLESANQLVGDACKSLVPLSLQATTVPCNSVAIEENLGGGQRSLKEWEVCVDSKFLVRDRGSEPHVEIAIFLPGPFRPNRSQCCVLNEAPYEGAFGRVQRYLRRRPLLTQKNLQTQRPLCRRLYRYWRRYRRMKEKQRIASCDPFAWGVLPVRAIDHPDQFVPVPAGFKFNDRFHPYYSNNGASDARLSTDSARQKFSSRRTATAFSHHTFASGICGPGDSSLEWSSRGGDIGRYGAASGPAGLPKVASETRRGSNYAADSFNGNMIRRGDHRGNSHPEMLYNAERDERGSTSSISQQHRRTWMSVTYANLTGPSLSWRATALASLGPEINNFFTGIHNDVLYRCQNRKVNKVEIEKHMRNGQLWSAEEIRIFLAKYFLHPKDFRRIAAFLENKTVKDCVDFYYRHKYLFQLKYRVQQLQPKGPQAKTLKRRVLREQMVTEAICILRPKRTELPVAGSLPDDTDDDGLTDQSTVDMNPSQFWRDSTPPAERLCAGHGGLPAFSHEQLHRLGISISSAWRGENNIRETLKAVEKVHQECKEALGACSRLSADDAPKSGKWPSPQQDLPLRVEELLEDDGDSVYYDILENLREGYFVPESCFAVLCAGLSVRLPRQIHRPHSARRATHRSPRQSSDQTFDVPNIVLFTNGLFNQKSTHGSPDDSSRSFTLSKEQLCALSRSLEFTSASHFAEGLGGLSNSSIARPRAVPPNNTDTAVAGDGCLSPRNSAGPTERVHEIVRELLGIRDANNDNHNSNDLSHILYTLTQKDLEALPLVMQAWTETVKDFCAPYMENQRDSILSAFFELLCINKCASGKDVADAPTSTISAYYDFTRHYPLGGSMSIMRYIRTLLQNAAAEGELSDLLETLKRTIPSRTAEITVANCIEQKPGDGSDKQFVDEQTFDSNDPLIDQDRRLEVHLHDPIKISTAKGAASDTIHATDLDLGLNEVNMTETGEHSGSCPKDADESAYLSGLNVLPADHMPEEPVNTPSNLPSLPCKLLSGHEVTIGPSDVNEKLEPPNLYAHAEGVPNKHCKLQDDVKYREGDEAESGNKDGNTDTQVDVHIKSDGSVLQNTMHHVSGSAAYVNESGQQDFSNNEVACCSSDSGLEGGDVTLRRTQRVPQTGCGEQSSRRQQLVTSKLAVQGETTTEAGDISTNVNVNEEAQPSTEQIQFSKKDVLCPGIISVVRSPNTSEGDTTRAPLRVRQTPSDTFRFSAHSFSITPPHNMPLQTLHRIPGASHLVHPSALFGQGKPHLGATVGVMAGGIDNPGSILLPNGVVAPDFIDPNTLLPPDASTATAPENILSTSAEYPLTYPPSLSSSDFQPPAEHHWSLSTDNNASSV